MEYIFTMEVIINVLSFLGGMFIIYLTAYTKAKSKNKALLEDIEKLEDEQDELETSVKKKCGDCYGAGEEGECCNSCEDVKQAYKRKGWSLRDLSNIKQCVKAGEAEEGEGEEY